MSYVYVLAVADKEDYGIIGVSKDKNKLFPLLKETFDYYVEDGWEETNDDGISSWEELFDAIDGSDGIQIFDRTIFMSKQKLL